MKTKTVSLAFSPCPNDSFVMGGIASGKVNIPGIEFDIKLLDIDELNNAALEQRYDIIKVSCHAYLRIMENYTLLNTGAAMGYGNGPLLLSSKSRTLEELQDCSVVFPGKDTTAWLLFQLLGVETGAHHFIPYNEIIARVKSGEFDCGVIIHESRFTYKKSGLFPVCDLGEWWEKETGLPVPLGCFVIRKSIDNGFARKFEALMRRSFSGRSLEDAGSDQYIIDNSQEMEPAVLKKHIALYVNAFTRSLGETGNQAIKALAERAILQGLIT